MRLQRLGFVFLAFYLVFLGGSAYYTLVFPIRVFHHLFVTLVLALWLMVRLWRGEGLPQTPLNLPIYAAVGVWFLTALTSLDVRMAFENIWFPLTHVLFFFALVDLLQRGFQRLVFETQFLMAALVVFISGLELASWYFGLGIGSSIGWAKVGFPQTAPRLALAMNISTLLAGYVAPLITLCVGWALTVRRRDFRVVLWILAVLLGIVLVLTFSRGGVISALTGLGALAALRLAQTPRVTRRIPARLWFGAAALVGVIAIFGFVLLTLSEARRSGDEGRLDMWTGAVHISVDRPLLGVGPGEFGRAFRTYRDPSIARDKLASAHNAYLNTMAETGVIGVIISLWLGIAFLRTTWRTWNTASSPQRKLRVETTAAALLGVAVHSLVDVFTTTPIVLLILLLAAYGITGHRSRLDPRPAPSRRERWAAVIALIVVLGYGIWFIQLDRAQSHYQNSLSDSENALEEAHAAATIDPYLTLYPLQIAYLTGQQVADQPDADAQPAIAAYRHALQLEPTWDTGWINLAALSARAGDTAAALKDLKTAWDINALNSAPLHWARLAEQTKAAPAAEIVNAYIQGAAPSINNPDLPLAAFWGQTDLRRQAAVTVASSLPLDWQYRILVIQDPQRAYALVPSNPQSAPEWWVAGEYALTVKKDAVGATADFTQAIQNARTVGDYYVSRARAEWQGDPAAAKRDLDAAQLLGTQYEYPNAVRALMATTPQEQRADLSAAVPGRHPGQEFAAVLYGRASVFDVFPEMRFTGPGSAALQPWYMLARQYAAEGNDDSAIRVYRAILDVAPFETEAQQQLEQMEKAPTS
jgi:O-antigen ligase